METLVAVILIAAFCLAVAFWRLHLPDGQRERRTGTARHSQQHPGFFEDRGLTARHRDRFAFAQGYRPNCVDLVYDQAQRKGLTVSVAMAEDIHDWVLGDAARLRQILLDLVANGVKFTPSGSVTLAIDCVASPPDTLRFAVTDTGIEIKSENLASLFQRFS